MRFTLNGPCQVQECSQRAHNVIHRHYLAVKVALYVCFSAPDKAHSESKVVQ